MSTEQILTSQKKRVRRKYKNFSVAFASTRLDREKSWGAVMFST